MMSCQYNKVLTVHGTKLLQQVLLWPNGQEKALVFKNRDCGFESHKKQSLMSPNTVYHNFKVCTCYHSVWKYLIPYMRKSWREIKVGGWF